MSVIAMHLKYIHQVQVHLFVFLMNVRNIWNLTNRLEFVNVRIFSPPLQWFDSRSGPRLPYRWGFDITVTPHAVGLLRTSGRPVAEASTWQHTTLATDRNTCSRRDSNSQEARGRRPTP